VEAADAGVGVDFLLYGIGTSTVRNPTLPQISEKIRKHNQISKLLIPFDNTTKYGSFRQNTT
jgi:hypothetical protein